MVAYDIFMDASELGSTHMFFDGSRVIKLLAKAGCILEMLSAYEVMRQQGFCFDDHHLVLDRMLFALARERHAPGVHAIVAELDSSGAPIGDESYERIVHAYFSINAEDRAFRVLDTFRAAGAPVSRLLAFALYNTGTGLNGMDVPGRAVLTERLPRKVLSYLLMSPMVGPDEIVALLSHAMRFGKGGGILIEALSTRKVVEASPPELLEACAGYLLQVGGPVR